MNANQVVITEQNGAVWIAEFTGATGDRAVWVQWIRGVSAARPWSMGFYASTINEACDALNN